MDELLIGAKIKWIGDRISTIPDIAPRHIGRVVQFDYYTTDNAEDYSHAPIMGTLEGYDGTVLFVSGQGYSWSRVADLKVFRRELA